MSRYFGDEVDRWAEDGWRPADFRCRRDRDDERPRGVTPAEQMDAVIALHRERGLPLDPWHVDRLEATAQARVDEVVDDEVLWPRLRRLVLADHACEQCIVLDAELAELREMVHRYEQMTLDLPGCEATEPVRMICPSLFTSASWSASRQVLVVTTGECEKRWCPVCGLVLREHALKRFTEEMGIGDLVRMSEVAQKSKEWENDTTWLRKRGIRGFRVPVSTLESVVYFSTDDLSVLTGRSSDSRCKSIGGWWDTVRPATIDDLTDDLSESVYTANGRKVTGMGRADGLGWSLTDPFEARRETDDGGVQDWERAKAGRSRIIAALAVCRPELIDHHLGDQPARHTVTDGCALVAAEQLGFDLAP